METVIEFEHRGDGKTGWWRMVTIEPNEGPRHYLTIAQPATLAAARKRARFEGVRFVEIAQK